MTVLPAADVTFDAHVPIVIVGAGAAGLIAGLEARRRGADTLLLERDPLPRGSTALSAGLIPAADTRWQRDAGIDDDPASFAADIMAKAHGEPDPALVDAFTQRAGAVLEWLADAHGLPFSVLDDFTYPGHSARRMHGLPTRSGAELIDRLLTAAEAAEIDILCNAHVTTLYTDSRHIRGLAYIRPDGSTERVGCDALILACNGYGGDPALVAQHIPDLAGALYFGHPGNQGDAIRWGRALGAASRDLSGHQGHGSVAHPIGILITWATITEGGVQVNTAGERFSNEMGGYSEQAAFVLRQSGGIAWTVFDGRIAAIARQFEDFRQAEAAGAILTAPAPASLAAAMNVPAPALAASMARQGPSFGRDFAGTPPLAPPFHAVRVTGALFHTQGGLAIDPGGVVLDPAGHPFPNLFAAGGAACGVSGRSAAGYLSGNGLLSAVAGGSLAAESAARLHEIPLDGLSIDGPHQLGQVAIKTPL